MMEVHDGYTFKRYLAGFVDLGVIGIALAHS